MKYINGRRLFAASLGVFAVCLSFWLYAKQSRHRVLPPPASLGAITEPSVPPASNPPIKPSYSQDLGKGGLGQTVSQANNQPIDFYGQLVDQEGVPVPGATVRGAVMVESQWMGGHFVDYRTVSDSSGRFSFRGLHGAEIVIDARKEGYQYDAGKRSFYYSLLHPYEERHHPASDSPTVLVMWKKRGSTALMIGKKFLGIKADGTPVRFDFLRGKKAEDHEANGDLILRVQRPPTVESGHGFDWSYTVEATDGGLIDAAQMQYKNEAPENGYQASVTGSYQANDRSWTDVVHRSFFIKSRGNKFGFVSLEIRAKYQDAAAIGIEYRFNPKSDLRNLESDPRLALSPER